ncbi:MAG: hypothetical protein WBC04_21680 [Candidatus Acidiferrales bacterium]
MREIVFSYLNNRISRRGFVNRLLGMGFSVASAKALSSSGAHLRTRSRTQSLSMQALILDNGG